MNIKLIAHKSVILSLLNLLRKITEMATFAVKKLQHIMHEIITVSAF